MRGRLGRRGDDGCPGDEDCVCRVCCDVRLGCLMAEPGWTASDEREGWLNPDGLGVGVPAVVPVAAVRGLAGDA